MVSILSLFKILGADIEEQLDWFQSKGLIARRKNCPACTNPMDLQKRSDITDKYRYNMTKLRQKVASQTLALGVMCIVPDHTAATLLPILQRHLRSGTIVNSDQWAAYNHVQQLPSVTSHSTVNHSLHFIDPGTGIHTQNVESYWNCVKGKFKRMKGVHEEMM